MLHPLSALPCRLLALALLLTLALPTAVVRADEDTASDPGVELPWVMEMAKATAQAKKEKKDLLVLFTGSDWCIYCERLNDLILTRPAFATPALERFVFVYLDSPRGEEAKKKVADVKTRDAWKRDLRIDALPTLILATADGAPYARTHFLRDSNPESYLKHLDTLRSSGAKVKQMLAKQTDGASLKAGLGVLQSHLLLTHPAYSSLLESARTVDADGKLGLKALVEAELARQAGDKERAALDAEMENRPRSQVKWAKVHEVLKDVKTLTGETYVNAVFGTVAWLLQEERGADALALLKLALRDPTFTDNATAARVHTELADQAKALVAKDANAEPSKDG